ncbi:MAG: GAF domain-containing protein [Actinobacteria bacterium]|nr:GAF domain-containing protein [Actinomycetota bacterium]
MKKLREIFNIFRSRLGLKIVMPVLAVLALFSVPFLFVFHMERVVDYTSSEVAAHNEAIDHLSQMEVALGSERVAVYELVFDHRTDMIGNFESAAAAAQMWHDEAMNHASTPDEIAALEECQALHEHVKSVVMTQIVPVIESSNPDHMKMVPAEDELQASFTRMTELRDQVQDAYVADKQAALAVRASSRQAASRAMWTSLGVAVLLGLLAAGTYARRLVFQIRGLAEASMQIARGDLSQRVPIKGHDELTSAAQNFNDMADSLERRTQQLQREKARLRSIHQSIGDGIIVSDGTGVIVSVNPAAEKILGKPVTELERTTNTGVPDLQKALFRKIPPDEMIRCWEAMDCTKSDCPAYGSDDFRCWLQCGTFCNNKCVQSTFRQKRDACERCGVFTKNAIQRITLAINGRHYSTNITPILDDEGQEEGRTVVMHDVTGVLRAKEQAERHSAELAAIVSVSEAVSQSLDLSQTLHSALDKVLELINADAAAIHLWDDSEECLVMFAQRGFTENMKSTLGRVPWDSGLAGAVVKSGETVVVNDTRQDRQVLPAAKAEGILSVMAVPLKVKTKIIGVMYIPAMRPGVFSKTDARLMTLIANQVAMAIENSIMYESSLQRSREMQARNHIVSVLTSSVEVEKIIDEFSLEIRRLAEFDLLSISVFDDGGSRMKTILPQGMSAVIARDEAGLSPTSGSATEWVLLNQTRYVSGNIGLGEEQFMEQQKFLEQGLRSQLNLPLKVKDRILGTMNMASRKADAYDEKTIGRLQPVADHVALALANQKLFEDVANAKNEWETTFDSASEGIAMVSRDHRIQRLNRAAAKMIGGEVEDLIGRRCYEVIHSGCSKPALCLMSQSIQETKSVSGEQEMDDGRTLELVVDPVYDSDRNPVGAVHFLRDITEAKRLRQQLVQSEKMIAVGQLVAGVAHEINNPLTGVIGYAQLLQSRDIDEQAKKDAEGIYREAERATRIVRHLLSFARKYQPERRMVDMNAVLRESIELKAYDLRVNNIQLEVDLDETLPMTNADPHQLQQVFLNLINNAEQAMLEDRGSGILRITSSLEKDQIRCTFVDDGPGIPEDVRERVFDPFFTTKDVGKGTGLGLSVCFGVAQDHGGRIWVEPGQGRGAVFVLEIPVKNGAPYEKKAEKGFDFNGRIGKILLVDDEEAIRQVLAETLTSVGHEVETADNGEVALDLLKQKHFDCVVSDVKMPGMDGQALHQAALQMDPALAGHFIFISGDTVSPKTRTFLDRINNPWLAKPFAIEDLERLLQEILTAAGN